MIKAWDSPRLAALEIPSGRGRAMHTAAIKAVTRDACTKARIAPVTAMQGGTKNH